jgi:release factor glutamine methyltransferase
MNYVCGMKLSEAYQDFVKNISIIYPQREAENIAHLVTEKITRVIHGSIRNTDLSLNDDEIGQIQSVEKKLLNNEPVQYILNEAWFYDAPFYVDHNVLIPRPETEELVDWMIRENKHKESFSILEIGAGSGCIPITLKRKLPQAKVMSCDISQGALEVAKRNAAQLQAEVEFLQLDILNPKNWMQLPMVDIIVSNPPYITNDEKTTIAKNVIDNEPGVALFVPDDNPLVFYEVIAVLGKTHLKPHGCIYVEINEGLGNQVKSLFNKNQYNAELRKDMQEKDRMVKAFR